MADQELFASGLAGVERWQSAGEKINVPSVLCIERQNPMFDGYVAVVVIEEDFIERTNHAESRFMGP